MEYPQGQIQLRETGELYSLRTELSVQCTIQRKQWMLGLLSAIFSCLAIHLAARAVST